jgi:methylmalonyl-CoA/ethylmalonyl-CoA epimerase
VTHVRRLDHVAIVVRSTDAALSYYEGRLGLRVQSSEELESPLVRLTYVDAGNAYLQLVEPLDDSSAIAGWLAEHGEGLHHVCFGVDDVHGAATAMGDPGRDVQLGNGRGRLSAFVPTEASHGVRIECTEFDHSADVDAVRGYLGD